MFCPLKAFVYNCVVLDNDVLDYDLDRKLTVKSLLANKMCIFISI